MARKRYKKRNPTLSLRRPLGAVTAGFKPGTLIGAAPVALGVVAGMLVRKQIAKFFAPAGSGMLSYVAGLAGAGLLSMVPRFGPKLFGGAVLGEVLRFGNSVLPSAYQIPGLSGMGDYMMGDYMQGMGDYMQGIGDYIGEGTTGAAPEVNSDPFDVGASDQDNF